MALQQTELIDRARAQRLDLLFAFYDLSNGASNTPVLVQEAAKMAGMENHDEVLAAATYLSAKGLFHLDGGGWTGYITVDGVDFVERHRKPLDLPHENPASPSHLIISNSPGANVNFAGRDISQRVVWLEKLKREIEKTDASDEEKRKAKSILETISENKLLNTIIGGVIGAYAKSVVSGN